MTKETKESKREQIAEAREKFLLTSSLNRIHYGEPGFLEEAVLWGVKPIRILVDTIDNLQADGDYEAVPLLLNEVQRKLDELMDAFKRWDDEERAAKNKKVPRPIAFELLKLEGCLKSIPGELQEARDSFETLRPLLAGLQKRKAAATETLPQDSAGAKQKA